MQDTNYSEDIASEIRSSVRGGEESNDLSEYAQTILNVLRESSEPVGRSNVMGRDRDWETRSGFQKRYLRCS